MATPRDHIEEIRSKKFNIGGEPDPKNEDLHHAVNYLSAELYSNDVHFLMELIQNAEDNEYLEGVQPSLEFVITSQDITATGAAATLLVFNNEKGFSPKNIESICSVGRSTKKGFRKRGYIGEKEDGPFIDEDYYGSKIKSYRKELNLVGVTVEVRNGCSLLATHLDSHINFSTIKRIYKYLYKFNWESDCGDTKTIWIPNGNDDGEWVIAEECVLSDKNDLFGMQLNVLEKHYNMKLLHFFCKAFGVRCMPSVDDYCKLWKAWECSGRPLSNNECRAFWEYVVKHWNLKTQKTLDKHLVKLPVYSGSDGILLFERHDVFIADDLQLKDLFEKCSSRPLFVWYPQPSVPSLPRGKLLEVYSKIGVRNISESVMKEEAYTSEAVCVREVVPRENLVGKGLVRLILGFLADLSLQMEAEKRHEAVRSLLDIIVLETVDLITIDYSLLLSSGEILKGVARRMIRWERESKKFFTQKMDRSDGHSSVIEYATCLSEAISEGLLWEKEDHMQQLAELIKLGFFVEFNDKAIEFLMKTKNLQLFLEDERFLSSAFLSD